MEKPNPNRSTYLNRMIRAARLDATLYEEVKNDRSSFAQALGVVILAGLSTGVVVASSLGTGEMGGVWILGGTVAALVEWFIWTWFLYLIGTRLFPEPQTAGDYGQLLRSVGFASVIGIARLLVLVPGLVTIALPVVTVWMLIATVIAVRVALNYSSNLRAFGVCAIGFAFEIGITLLLRGLLGGGNLPVSPG